MSPFLTPELALRVGLAAKALEGISHKVLVPIIIELVGLPLTKDRFGKVTVTDLKQALEEFAATTEPRPQVPEVESLKAAVRYLWGFKDEDAETLPEATENYDLEGSVRVAVATTDGTLVDEHFGGSLRYFVYQVNATEIELTSIRSTAESVDSDDPSAFRAELLQDCDVLYVQSIGGPAAAKVIQRGIYPLKMEARPAVQEVLTKLQERISNNPPPWLAKALNIPVEDRIRFQQETVTA